MQERQADETWRPTETTVVAELHRRTAEAPDAPAARFMSAADTETVFTRAELWRESGKRAARLEAAGLRPGQVCALIFPFRPEIGAWYWGAARLGALPTVLAYPTPRLHPDKFRSGLRGMAQHSGLDFVVTDAALRKQVEPLLSGGTVGRLLTAGESAEPVAKEPWPDDRFASSAPDAPFLLQHSSGTTGLQKAVVLSHRAILEQLECLAEALNLRPAEDVIVSWLPLYHDMGLIAAWLLPFLSGTEHVQLSPLDWVARPALFLKALAHRRGTMAWLPNFAYPFTADRVSDEELAGLRLERVRALINCSEPVRAAAFDKFFARLRPCGLRSEALAASYALAENVFAATQTPPGTPPARFSADAAALQTAGEARRVKDDGAQAVRVCVSSGRPLRGTEIEIRTDAGRPLEERRVGEIALRSPYLFDGYRRKGRPAGNDGAGGRPVRDGFAGEWFLTGDLGFLDGGELYVVGRKKDLLIVGGKNIYPEDVEDCAGEVPGVLPGRAAAWGEYVEALGTETVMLLAETNLDDEKQRYEAASKIRAAVRATLDLNLFRVYFVPPRSLIKSSSGKIARRTNVERFRTGELQEL